MYEGVLSPPLRNTPLGCMLCLWDEGCLKISAIKVAGINPSESRARDCISSPCRKNYAVFLFLHGKSNTHMIIVIV